MRSCLQSTIDCRQPVKIATYLVVGIPQLSVASSMLRRAGAWLVQSGIQEPGGGVARYYRSDAGRNLLISTEITGYAVSAFTYLARVSSDSRYLDAAGRAARFLYRSAWNPDLAIFPFEYSANCSAPDPLAYF